MNPYSCDFCLSEPGQYADGDLWLCPECFWNEWMHREGEPMKLINMTPHPVTFILADEDKSSYTLQPSGTVPRVDGEQESLGEVVLEAGKIGAETLTIGMPLTRVRPGKVVDLPEPQANTLLLVSRITAEAAPDRADLVFPEDFERDKEGKILGCKKLGTVSGVMESRRKKTSLRPL